MRPGRQFRDSKLLLEPNELEAADTYLLQHFGLGFMARADRLFSSCHVGSAVHFCQLLSGTVSSQANLMRLDEPLREGERASKRERAGEREGSRKRREREGERDRERLQRQTERRWGTGMEEALNSPYRSISLSHTHSLSLSLSLTHAHAHPLSLLLPGERRSQSQHPSWGSGSSSLVRQGGGWPCPSEEGTT